MTNFDDLAVVIARSAHGRDRIVTALDIHPCRALRYTSAVVPRCEHQHLKPTIMVSIREANGNVKLVHPIGQGPSRMCSGGKKMGDGIL